jgi:uncharacterized protein YdeI (YjbR/CyaY-like superfamily)
VAQRVGAPGRPPRYRGEVEEVRFSGRLQEAGRGGHVVVVDPKVAAKIARSPRAAAVWGRPSPSRRREYIQRVLGAKQPETRRHRIAKSIATLEGSALA